MGNLWPFLTTWDREGDRDPQCHTEKGPILDVAWGNVGGLKCIPFGNGCPWEFSGFLRVSIEVIEETGYRWGRNPEASSNHKVGCFPWPHRHLQEDSQILPKLPVTTAGKLEYPGGLIPTLRSSLLCPFSLLCLLGLLTLQQGVCLSSRGQAEPMVPGASSAWWDGADLEFRLAGVNGWDTQGKARRRQHLSCLLSLSSPQQGESTCWQSCQRTEWTQSHQRPERQEALSKCQLPLKTQSSGKFKGSQDSFGGVSQWGSLWAKSVTTSIPSQNELSTQKEDTMSLIFLKIFWQTLYTIINCYLLFYIKNSIVFWHKIVLFYSCLKKKIIPMVCLP